MQLRNGYIGVYNPSHHRAMKNGIVYEHILVAEQILGRELKKDEVVHHIDSCRTNNDPANIVVFRTLADHTRFHETGRMEITNDGTYIAPESECPSGYNLCPVCGKLKAKRSSTCASCRAERDYVKPEKDVLIRLALKHNKSQIGRMCGVSCTAVRKWLKSYELCLK